MIYWFNRSDVSQAGEIELEIELFKNVTVN